MVAIGIDLGTTNSVVAVWKDDKAIIIQNDEGHRVTPSIVAFTDSKMLVGDQAKNQMVLNPENTVFEAKRILGQNFSNPELQSGMKLFPFAIVDDGKDNPVIQVMFQNKLKTFAPEQISSFVLQKMKTLAETFLQEEVTDAVITIPAYFDNNQRHATIDAAVLAGLKVLRIIHEPTAAALAYGLEFKPKGTNNVVIFDLGGGTFYVSVLKIKEGSAFDVLAVGGNTHLGGVDFDNLLVEHCIEEFRQKHKIDLNNRALRRLQQACERAKITLSQSEEAMIDLDCIQDGLDFSVVIERGEFELMCRQLFEETLECVRGALADAKLKPSEIDEILLIGGSTRIPKIRALLQNLFDGKNLNSAVHPDEAVAHGAAIQAAILSGAFCNRFGHLNDVTPLSLGVATSMEELMSVIIPRNTKIPHKNTSRYQTAGDFQTSIKFDVYEGERRFVADNVLLSQFMLHNVTPAKKGQTKVDVQFTLNENGILFVTATEVGNTNTASIQIENISGRLSKDTIDKMMRDAEKYRQFDDDRVFCIALRNQMNNYISNCLDNLAEVDNIEDCVIEEVANECAIEVKWLKSNPQALKSEVQHHFDRLKTVVNTKLKPKTRSSKLMKIFKSFQAALQNTNEGNAPSTSSATHSADVMNVEVKAEQVKSETINVTDVD